MEKQNLNFEVLPDEILLKIFSYNLPEETRSLRYTAKNFNVLLTDNLYWENKFKCHFPYAYNKIKLNNPTSWFEQFMYEYKTDYNRLSENIKLLFSIAKEGSLEGLKDYIAKNSHNNAWLSDLASVDTNAISILEWIRENQQQALLDYIYSCILAINPNSRIVIDKEISLSARSILWPILCRQSTFEIFTSIETNQASINDCWLYGYQSIHFAAEDNRIDVIEKLIAAGVAVDTMCNIERRVSIIKEATALSCAAAKGALEAFETLLKLGAAANTGKHELITALHYAAAKGHNEVIKFLLKNTDIDINAYDRFQQTALTYAIIHNRKDTIDLLLFHKANINFSGPTGLKTIHILAKVADKHAIQLAITLGADIKDIDNKRSTPLHHAARAGNYDVIDFLIAPGFDVDIRNADGKSPLHYAADASWLRDGELLHLHSVLSKNFKVFHFYPAQPISDYHDAFPWVMTIEKLLQHKANPNLSRPPIDVSARDLYGSTPLHIAVSNNNPKVIAVLLRFGADINISNQHEPSPIWSAVYARPPELESIETLLKCANDLKLAVPDIQALLEFLSSTLKYSKNFKVFKLLSIYAVQEYINKAEQRSPDARQKFLFWEVGYTAKQKLAAANALLKVINEEEKISSLERYESILNQGELGKIYASILPIINYMARYSLINRMDY